jgi:hypothetical protein
MKPGILYDGWSLVFTPNSYAAIHLLTLLACQPQDWQVFLALPGQTMHEIPGWAEIIQKPVKDTDLQSLTWEQALIPQLARKTNARLIHLTSNTPPLLGSVPVIVSPTNSLTGSLACRQTGQEKYRSKRDSLLKRLQDSLGEGGFSRVRGLLWPSDLSIPVNRLSLESLPPAVHPLFSDINPLPKLASLDLQKKISEPFVLYHGSGCLSELTELLAIWSWVVRSFGVSHRLLLAGFPWQTHSQVKDWLAKYEALDTIEILPELHLRELVAVYQNCSALISIAPLPPWGDPLRYAITCGKPIIAPEDALSDAIAGPAAYLVRGQVSAPGNPTVLNIRSLSAALISVLVEQSLAGQLSRAAFERRRSWPFDLFKAKLSKVYSKLLGLEHSSGKDEQSKADY